MTLATNMDTGTTKVEQAGKEKSIEFKYAVIPDEPRPTFDEVVSFLLQNGFQTELPTEEEMKQLKEENKGQRGKVAEPKSLTRALVQFYEQSNYTQARAQAISEAENTVDAGISKIVAQFDALLKRTDLSAEQRTAIEAKKAAISDLVTA